MVAEGKGNGRHSESRKRMGGQSWGFEQGDTCWAYGRRGQAGLHGKEFGCCRDEWMDRDTGAGTVSVMASDRAKAACAPSPSGLSAAASDRGEGNVLSPKPPARHSSFVPGHLVGRPRGGSSPRIALLGLVVEQGQHVFPREGRRSHALAAQHAFGQVVLAFLHLQDALLDCVLADELEHAHGPRLPDAVGAVGRLILG